MRRGVAALAVATLLTLAGGGAAVAQKEGQPAGTPGAPAGPVLAEVRLEGVPAADSVRTLAALGLRPGSRATAAAVRDGLHRLSALGLFDDVWVGLMEGPGGTVLTVHASERSRVARIEMTGNRKVDSDKLLEHTGLVVGARYSAEQLEAAVDSVRRIYREKGYVRAEVSASTASAGPGQSAVAFRIEEGRPARVRGATFPGATSFPSHVLRKRLASKCKGFLKSGKLDPDKLAKDVEALTEFYRDRGFREVEVTRDSLHFSPDGQKITLVYDVKEGARVHLGAVRWSGNKALADAQVATLTRVKRGDLYDASAILKTRDDAYAQYAEQGFLYVSIDPVEQPDDSGRVAVDFQVQEGAPSHLRRINITGNTRTKEKVVRRELIIHEGDLFRRSALIRTQQDVFRLGYFSDVQVGFEAADSTDVDLSLKVVEKETGTASAGAGYSSDGGLTGFVQLGHNNLFGNGQSVSIQLERGAKRSNVDLSFTDPYFRDSRTTLGASIFSRDQLTQIVGTGSNLDYRDKRRGGSLRLGRPLGFLDYTRAYLTYRLERVTLVAADNAAASDSAQLALEAYLAGGAQTTSSVSLTVNRDNTVNPFYPKGGSRVSWSSEFAGGPLGGKVEFNKHEIDARVYWRSFLHRITTMVRLRGGFLGGYGRTVPAYETFRLGGTTYYGVRGYQDYEVVPAENVRTVFTTTSSQQIDTSQSPPETTTVTSRTGRVVAYPGGRWMQIFTVEQQFPIVEPVHAVLFFDAGAAWNEFRDIQLFKDLRTGAGAGLRVEVPILGNIGLDFGYGFNRARPGWRTHFLLGNLLF